MNKALLLALTLLASSAWADWTKLGETDEGSFYIDPASVPRNGHLRPVQDLTDLKQRDEGGESPKHRHSHSHDHS